eukprot:gb/GECH01001897.1/.p1 GENE.gb/GECH01001897.1/~~gb/GECH01001897.1/.p1  ORF type:complete len:126 (+),score=25.15 gb/GECH01001897.1/:1-378(+)
MDLFGEEIPDGYDSAFTRVDQGNNGHHPTTSSRHYYDEYCIRDRELCVPSFILTLRRTSKLFLWKDEQIRNKYNSRLFSQLNQMQRYNLYVRVLIFSRSSRVDPKEDSAAIRFFESNIYYCERKK